MNDTHMDAFRGVICAARHMAMRLPIPRGARVELDAALAGVLEDAVTQDDIANFRRDDCRDPQWWALMRREADLSSNVTDATHAMYSLAVEMLPYCTDCNGGGQVADIRRDEVVGVRPCPSCNGTGRRLSALKPETRERMEADGYIPTYANWHVDNPGRWRTGQI